MSFYTPPGILYHFCSAEEINIFKLRVVMEVITAQETNPNLLWQWRSLH